jgi:hypothetical protein
MWSEAVDERKGISVSDESLNRADEERDDDTTVEAHTFDSVDAVDSVDSVDAKDDEGDDDVHAHSFDAPAAAMDTMDSVD